MMYDHPFISQNQHPLLGETCVFHRFAGILVKKRENVWQSKIPACIFPRFRVQYKRRKNQQYAKILMQFKILTYISGNVKGEVHSFLLEMYGNTTLEV